MGVRNKIVSNTFYFSVRLVIECYQFLFNLPLILASVLAGVHYEPVPAPQLEHLILGFEKLLECMDCIVSQILNLLEFHVVLTPAAVICLVLGRWEALRCVQDKMDSFYKDPAIVIQDELMPSTSDVVSDIIDELIDELPNENEISSKQGVLSPSPILKNKSMMSSPVNESGYLSDLEFR